jgi:hypothetical protein
MLSPAPRPDPGVKEELRWSLDGFRARSTRFSRVAVFVLGVTKMDRLDGRAEITCRDEPALDRTRPPSRRP